MSTLSLQSGVTLDTSNTKFTGQSLRFDGTQISGNLNFNIEALFGKQNSITVECWVYAPAAMSVFPWSVYNGPQSAGPELYFITSTYKWAWYGSNRTGIYGSFNQNGPVALIDFWQLLTVELEYDGANSTRVRRYFNGTKNPAGDQILSIAGSDDYSIPGFPGFSLGNYGTSTSTTFGKWQGNIGPTRVSRGLLYNSTTCTVPTTAFTQTGDTILIVQ